MIRSFIKFTSVPIIAGFLLLGGLVFAQATPTKALLLWTAEDVVLARGYPGRALPTPGSTLRVSALLLPTSAQTRDLEYRWFVNGGLLRRGQDLKSITFVPASEGASDVSVEIRRGDALIARADAPISVGKTELAIIAEGIGWLQSGIAIPWREELRSRALLMFFPRRPGETVILQWSVDGIPVTGEEGGRNALTLTLTPGDLRPLRLGLEVENANRPAITANIGTVVNLVSQ